MFSVFKFLLKELTFDVELNQRIEFTAASGRNFNGCKILINATFNNFGRWVTISLIQSFRVFNPLHSI